MASKQKNKQTQPQKIQTDVYDSIPVGQLILAWAVVGVPLVYGVSQVFIKSLALFK